MDKTNRATVNHYVHIISGTIAFIAFVLILGIAGKTDTGTAIRTCLADLITLLVVFGASVRVFTRTY